MCLILVSIFLRNLHWLDDANKFISFKFIFMVDKWSILKVLKFCIDDQMGTLQIYIVLNLFSSVSFVRVRVSLKYIVHMLELAVKSYIFCLNQRAAGGQIVAPLRFP